MPTTTSPLTTPRSGFVQPDLCALLFGGQPMGFKLDIWDYITFASIFVLVVGAVALVVFLMGLPGRIAIARKHPDAEAVNMMGWLGFLAVVPWIQAFIWAFKPTDIVDIRRTPREEKEAIEEIIARMSGKPLPEEPKQPKPGKDAGPHA
jgi:Protein of unknown function (DUF3302)